MDSRTTAPAHSHRCATSPFRPDAVERLEPRRFLSAGNLDPAFNGGQPLFVGPSHAESLETLAIRPLANGQTLVAGTPSDENGVGTPLVLERLNADGSLDTTFGDGGRQVFTEIIGRPYVAFDAQDRLVALDGQRTLYRITADGRIDPGFNPSHVPFRRIPALVDLQPQSLAVSPAGAVYVGGFSPIDTNPLERMAIACFRASGRLSKAFGQGGVAFGSASANGAATLALQLDGKLIAAGGDANHLLLTRFNRNGAVDPTFARAGVATLIDGRSDRNLVASQFYSVAVAPGGKIYALGGAQDPEILVTNRPILVAAFRRDGSLDKSFGTAGVLRQTVGHAAAAHAEPDVLALVGDRLFVGGTVVNTRGSTAFVESLDRRNGEPNTTFGSAGLALFPAVQRNVHPFVTDIDPTPDGNGLLFGLDQYTSDDDQTLGPSLARLAAADGQLDASFATGGLASVTVPVGDSVQPDDLFADASGAYVGTMNGPNAEALTRVTPTGVIDAAYGRGGGLAGDNRVARAVLADGSVLAAASGLGVFPDGTLALYRPDGTLDPSFGAGGVLTFPAFAPTDGFASIPLAATRPDGTILVEVVRQDPTPDFANYQRSIRLFVIDRTGQILQAQDGPTETLTPYNGLGSAAPTPAGGLEILTATQGIQRFNADLTPDAVFNANGANANSVAFAAAPIVQPDGGTLGLSLGSRTLYRLNPDGSVDNTFAGAGGLSGPSYVSAFIVQSDGRIITASLSPDGVLLHRYTAAGLPDATFGHYGHAFVKIRGVENAVNLAIRPTASGEVLVIAAYVNAAAAGSPLGAYGAEVAQVEL